MDELEDISSIVFIMNAEYQIGFSIDGTPRYKIKMINQDIGAYGMSMGKKSDYCYRTS